MKAFPLSIIHYSLLTINYSLFITIMLFYFSGTGNSRWVALQLGDLLQEKVWSVADVLEDSQVYTLGDTEAVGFVFPVYAWGPPDVFLRWMRSVQFSRKPAYLYFVCTCGDDAGKTADVFIRAVAERGWECVAGFSVWMPNTYVCLPGFDVDSEGLAFRKLREARMRVGEIYSCLQKREKGFGCYEGSFPWLKTYVLRPLFRRFLMSSRAFRVTGACISCGKCEQVCPLHNIRLAGGTPQWGEHCAMCLACYHHCPRHAIAYGHQTRHKGQFTLEK